MLEHDEFLFLWFAHAFSHTFTTFGLYAVDEESSSEEVRIMMIHQSQRQDSNAEAIIRGYYDEIFIAGTMNRAAIERYFAADFVGHDLPLGLQGREGYAKFVGMLALSFGELTPIAAGDLFSHGDKVVARWASSGRHSAEFMGIPATGRRVTLKGIDIFRLREGKIADLWQEIDLMSILQQISAPTWG